MTGRARLFTLYARREAARGAEAGRTLADRLSQAAEARSMAERLQQLVTDIAVPRGEILAAGLRDTGILTSNLVQEAERFEARATMATPEIDHLRGLVGQHNSRRDYGEAAAARARTAEIEASEARADALRMRWRRPV